MSETKTTQKKNWYAWVIMVVLCFASICGIGLVTNTYGVFLPSIVKDLKFGAGQVALIMTIASWITVAFYSLGAKVMEKYNPRYVTTIAGVGVVLALIGYANATQIWHFYLIAAFMGTTGAFNALNVVPLLINKWFVKHRNLVVGIIYMFTGIAGAAFNPLMASISQASGWRTGYYVAAGIAAIWPILCIIFVRATPADMGLKPYGIEESEEMKDIADQVEIKEYPGIPAKYAFKTSALWLIFIFIVTNAFGTGFNQHWVNLGVTSGFNLVTAATLTTIAMLSSALFKVIIGWVNDKFGVLKSSLIFTVCGMISMIILMLNTNKSFAMIQIACIFFGPAVSMTTLQPPMLTRDIFGMRSYSTLYPIAFMAMSIGAGFTYGLHGFFIQLTGSYMGSFIFNLISYLIGFICILIMMKVVKPIKEKYWREVGQAL